VLGTFVPNGHDRASFISHEREPIHNITRAINTPAAIGLRDAIIRSAIGSCKSGGSCKDKDKPKDIGLRIFKDCIHKTYGTPYNPEYKNEIHQWRVELEKEQFEKESVPPKNDGSVKSNGEAIKLPVKAVGNF
jgi:hypothetical protein